MFKFFKKKEPVLYAPVQGKCIALEMVSDQVFASKMMGDGVAFIPETQQITAPCDAVISMIASTKHAIGLVSEEGAEILIHIGLDTVNYMGKGFELHVKKDQRVKKGELLITFDRQFFEKEKVCLTTPMVITNGSKFDLELVAVNQQVNPLDTVIRYTKIK